MTMQAILLHKYGTENDLTFEEIEKPVPKDDEVLVRVHASAVNDWELGIIEGKPLFMRLFLGFLRPKLKIMGTEVAGVVEAVGKDVLKYRPGHKVYGDLSAHKFGAFAEFLCTKESAVAHMPTNLSFDQSAAIPHAGLLALQALRDIADFRAGQSLLINGAGGGVGCLGIQLAKMHKNVRETGVDSTEKLEHMALLSFDEVIDYTRQNFTELGKQYDVILDTKSTRSPAEIARALKPNGIYVTVGGNMNRIFQIAFLSRFMRNKENRQFHVLGLKPNKGLEYLTGLVEGGRVIPAIDSRYPLEQTPLAIRRLKQASHKGKIIISVAAVSLPLSADE
ncbi:MAG: NAD(P)-dependent alcohol dehydrogenase [Gammaproteobacteria bacterium]|nr:NAD(P)-dependent alcohol dehydrogenase [Gammaproteobacteria bacterium]MDD9958879.1 NAD(P)-dependent alcohol dehydrogenase [Gammaproteobacteria bacterium]